MLGARSSVLGPRYLGSGSWVLGLGCWVLGLGRRSPEGFAIMTFRVSSGGVPANKSGLLLALIYRATILDL